MFGAGLGEGDDPETVAQRRWQRIERIGRRNVADVREIKRHLQRRVGITSRSLRLQKSQEAIPETAVVVPGAGLFKFVDQHNGVGMFGPRDRQEGVARFGRVPAFVGAGEDGAVAAAGICLPPSDVEDYRPISARTSICRRRARPKQRPGGA